MLACGLDIAFNGTATLVILDPRGDDIVHISRLGPPLEEAEVARWMRETAKYFAPDPLWVAVVEIRWHWLDDLGTLPVRWVHYLSQALCGHLPNHGETPPDISRDAIALARALNADLRDLRLYHEEMFNLSLIRDCAHRLTELLPRTRRYHPFLRQQLNTTPLTDDVPV